MNFEGVVPILYSTDVVKSLNYYMEKLAFDDKWQWDEPTTFGGVSKDCVRIFFLPEWSRRSGNMDRN